MKMDEYLKNMDYASWSFSQKVLRGDNPATDSIRAIGAAGIRPGGKFQGLVDAAGAMETLLNIPVEDNFDPVCRFALDITHRQV